MSTRGKWIAVIVMGTVIAVLFGANGPLGGFWGVEEGAAEPSGGLLAGLIAASMIESVAFGVGLAWFAFGWPLVNRTNRSLAVATYIATGWALISWAPHTSFHVSMGDEQWGRLVAVEWGFHVTLVIGAFIVATFVWRVFEQTSQPTADPRPATV